MPRNGAESPRNQSSRSSRRPAPTLPALAPPSRLSPLRRTAWPQSIGGDFDGWRAAHVARSLLGSGAANAAAAVEEEGVDLPAGCAGGGALMEGIGCDNPPGGGKGVKCWMQCMATDQLPCGEQVSNCHAHRPASHRRDTRRRHRATSRRSQAVCWNSASGEIDPGNHMCEATCHLKCLPPPPPPGANGTAPSPPPPADHFCGGLYAGCVARAPSPHRARRCCVAGGALPSSRTRGRYSSQDMAMDGFFWGHGTCIMFLWKQLRRPSRLPPRPPPPLTTPARHPPPAASALRRHPPHKPTRTRPSPQPGLRGRVGPRRPRHPRPRRRRRRPSPGLPEPSSYGHGVLLSAFPRTAGLTCLRRTRFAHTTPWARHRPRAWAARALALFALQTALAYVTRTNRRGAAVSRRCIVRVSQCRNGVAGTR